MRPKKCVVLYCAEVEQAEDRAFVLSTGVRFQPILAAQPFEIEWELEKRAVDTVLVLPSTDAIGWDKEAIEISNRAGVPVVVVSQAWAKDWDVDSGPFGRVCERSMAEVLSALGQATVLKRGPKAKKPVASVPQPVGSGAATEGRAA